MEHIVYKINDNSIENLKLLGFQHMGDGIYSYKFPVYKYNNIITIYGFFIANNENNEIQIDVRTDFGNLYAPYYRANNNNQVVKIIKKNISKEMQEMGIKKYLRKYKNK